MLEKRGLVSKVIEYGLRHQHGNFKESSPCEQLKRIFVLLEIAYTENTISSISSDMAIVAF